MTNVNKLKGRIVEMGYNMSTFATAVNISRPCLRKRLTGESEFKAKEIEMICKVLDISQSDMLNYFFASTVPTLDTERSSLQNHRK